MYGANPVHNVALLKKVLAPMDDDPMADGWVATARTHCGVLMRHLQGTGNSGDGNLLT